MWQPIVDKMKRKSESERLDQVEKNILQLNEIVAWLEKRVKELEKANDK